MGKGKGIGIGMDMGIGPARFYITGLTGGLTRVRSNSVVCFALLALLLLLQGLCVCQVTGNVCMEWPL